MKITLSNPSPDYCRSVTLTRLRDGVVSVVVEDRTMLGKVERVGSVVRLDELRDAVDRL